MIVPNHESFDFAKQRVVYKTTVSDALAAKDDGQFLLIKDVNDSHTQVKDYDRKIIWDQAFRDYLLETCMNEQEEKFCKTKFENILKLSIECALASVCSVTLPVTLLADVFEVSPLSYCEDFFDIVEHRVSVWKQEVFFNQSKNILLRLCNDLLRRLSRSQNTVFCGRILLFLAKFFPFSERSGLNVVSEFNLDNVTACEGKKSISEQSNAHNPTSAEEKDLIAGSNLYVKFWRLQDYFRNPNQCYQKTPWGSFCMNADDVLSAFSTIKLDEGISRSKKDSKSTTLSRQDSRVAQNASHQYFAKYLTSYNLLELQLGDSNFRRYILLQFLIMFQYLESPVKFKQESQKLTEEQIAWASATTEKIYSLLRDTPPDGIAFAETIQHILKREEFWNNWKNEGCPEFRINANASNDLSKDTDTEARSTAGNRMKRPRRSIGDQIREAAKRKKCIIGNAEMNRLWNLCPDNMAACRSKDRDFLPSLENYFEEAIEQLDPSVESQFKRVNDANFGWRALRLLARRSLHFFTHGNTPITKLPDYLETHVKKLAKDIQLSSATSANVKSEPVDEGTEVEPLESENEPVATTSEADVSPEDSSSKTEETMESMETGPVSKKSQLCTIDQMNRLGERLGSKWKLLARKLGCEDDQIEFYESHHELPEEQAKKMLQIWLESDEDATPENLLYILEGLGMMEVASDIL
nr:EOG090X0324 [Moina brachiata]